MSLNATLHIFVEHQVDVIFMGVVPHRYLSITCYEDVIFNLYYFIAVSIGETCSMSSMKFNNPTFFILLLILSKFSQCFKILTFTVETTFLITL